MKSHCGLKFLLQLLSWPAVIVLLGIALAKPAMAHAPRNAAIYLYNSETTARWMQRQGQSYDPTLHYWRRYLKRYGTAVREITGEQLSALGPQSAVVIIPHAVALDEQERLAILALEKLGISVLGTGWIGTVSAQGTSVGPAFMEKVFHIRTHGNFQSNDGLFMLPFGDGPLTWPIPAGRRMDIGEDPTNFIRVQGNHESAVLLDWDRIMDQRPHGVLTYDESATQRYAYLGLLEAALPTKLRADMTALLDATLAWLRRQPQAYKAAWPNGMQSAHLIEMDTEDKYFSALIMAKHLEQFGFRGTFYSLTSEAVKYPEIVRELMARGHEIAYHADVHFGFGKLPASEQELRIQFMKQQLQPVLGNNDHLATGFRAPTESYDANTERLLRKHGIRHHAADPSSTDDRLPFFSIAEPGLGAEEALVVLPRTQWDDINFTYLRLSPTQVQQVMAYDLDLNVRSGAFGLLSVHSQFYVEGGLMNPLMEPYLKKVYALRDRLWVARGDEIAQWWRDRAKVQVHATPRTDAVDLKLVATQAVNGVTVFVTLPRKGASLRWVPEASAQTVAPRIQAIDAFRTALVFGKLPVGETRGQVQFP